MEALDTGKDFNKIFVQKGLVGEQARELKTQASQKGIRLNYVPKEKLNRITRKNHQGVVAYISPIPFYQLEEVVQQAFEAGRLPIVVILDQVTDVRNFGAIARSALCGGVDAILIPEAGSARIGEDAVKTSAGALLKIPVCRSLNLNSDLSFLKASGLKVIACTEKAENNIYQEDLTGPFALIIGSEGKGISNALLKRSEVQVKIPMDKGVASLNASVSAGIGIYEAVRQRMTS